MKQIIECVPNISEGRDLEKIKIISQITEKINGVKLLNVDPGKATNRTVITFVGEPQNVIDAAFLLIQKAQEMIDMSNHTGEHPRMGATDVCPLVPIANISIEECVEWAHKLGERVGSELGIPVYHYEASAKEEKRVNLSNCRKGEYEGLKKKL